MATKHKIPRLARMLALTLLIAVIFGYLFLMLSQSSRGKYSAAAGDKPVPSNASSVQAQATPTAVAIPAARPTDRVIVPPITVVAATPSSPCVGKVPGSAKGQPAFKEDPPGSGNFSLMRTVVQGKVYETTLLGIEDFSGVRKTFAGRTYCQLAAGLWYEWR